MLSKGRERSYPSFWTDGGSLPIASDIVASESRHVNGYLLGPRVHGSTGPLCEKSFESEMNVGCL